MRTVILILCALLLSITAMQTLGRRIRDLTTASKSVTSRHAPSQSSHPVEVVDVKGLDDALRPRLVVAHFMVRIHQTRHLILIIIS
jgi:hypothetical protein